jgi:RimJ/RimL family protein N-acetyltransferase
MQIDLGPWLVRSLKPDDDAALAKHANNRKIWRNLRDAFPHPYTREDARKFIATVTAQAPETVFCIATRVEVIGAIGFRLQEDVERIAAEIGYWLAEDYWGQGITTAALKAVTAYAMQAHDLRRVYALPFAWNAASFRVLEKAGYVLEGRMRCSALKDGQVVDQLLYAYTHDDCRELA